MPRILLIALNPFVRPITGESQRSRLIYQSLRSMADVDTLLLCDPQRLTAEDERRFRDEFGLAACVRPRARGEFGGWGLLRPVFRHRVDVWARTFGRYAVNFRRDAGSAASLQRLTERGYDAIVGRYLESITKTGALAHTPVVLDVDDFPTSILQSMVDSPKVSNWRKRFHRRQLSEVRTEAGDHLSKCDQLWVSNERNRSMPGLERASVLPNIPFVKDPADSLEPLPQRPESKTIVAIGTLAYRPNVESIEFFVREVWPKICDAEPRAVFRIVGPGMRDRQRRKWQRVGGVEPVGFVDDVRAEYAACALTVATTFTGGGTHVKILESLGYGRTCVVTPFAHRGYEQTLRHNESLLVAVAPEDLAENCLELLRNAEKRDRMAERGRRIVSREFSYARFLEVVQTTMRAVLAGGKGLRYR